MKEKHKLLVSSLAKETELLESVDWDSDRLRALYEYLDIHFTGDSIISPSLLLEEIKNQFGEPCSIILRKMFLGVSLTNGLFIHDPDVEN